MEQAVEVAQAETDAERLQSLEATVRVLTDSLVAAQAQQSFLCAEIGALRSVAWAALANSPSAQETMEFYRGHFMESMRRRGLDEPHCAHGADTLERILLSAKQERRRTLPAFTFGLAHDLLSTVDGLFRPSRWTWRTAVMVLGAVGAGAALAFM